MRRNAIWLVAVALVVAGATTAVATSGNFRTHLSGDEEFPKRSSPAPRARPRSSSQPTVSRSATSSTSPTSRTCLQAHIHVGAPEKATARSWRSCSDWCLIPVSNVNGTLASGSIDAGDLIGPLVGQPLEDLVEVIEAGGAYVNVHTVAHRGGEIRGQL